VAHLSADGGMMTLPRAEFEAIVSEALILDCERVSATDRAAACEGMVDSQATEIDTLSWYRDWFVPVIGTGVVGGIIAGIVIGIEVAKKREPSDA
jgi:hypothetical protein